jgi:predicted PhzF superfamily epimerase YddE/YHI9
MSRIKEAYDETGNTGDAVANGLQRSGRIITSVRHPRRPGPGPDQPQRGRADRDADQRPHPHPPGAGRGTGCGAGRAALARRRPEPRYPAHVAYAGNDHLILAARDRARLATLDYDYPALETLMAGHG